MITPLDFLFDLFNPSLAFLPRALAAVTLASFGDGRGGVPCDDAWHGFLLAMRLPTQCFPAWRLRSLSAATWCSGA